jgi:transposase-like protein
MPSVLSAAQFHNEEAAYAFVEARLWASGRVCPHCGVVDKSGPLKGKSTRIGVYKCYACRKPFTVKVGTIFESSHIKLHVWLQAMHLLCSSKKGMSSHQLHRVLGVTLATAWFLSHRIREAMTVLKVGGPLGGANKVVEIDETYVGGKEANKQAWKRTPGSQGGANKAPVVSLVERDGSVRSFHVPNVTAETLGPVITANVDKATYLMTDGSTVYPGIGAGFAGHGWVNHSIEEYVRAYFWHTNTVENYFSILKRGIVGVYHHVSEAHLHRYAAEFDFRYNNRMGLGVDDVTRADRALAGVKGKRLTYRTTNRQIALDTPPF